MLLKKILEKKNSFMELSYFYKTTLKSKVSLLNYYLKQRKQRLFLFKSKKFKFFKIGDIIEFVFFYKSTPLLFRGICIAIYNKYFIRPDVTLILRNVILRIGVEVVASYYYNRIYKLKFLDYKRKFLVYNKNKLFFLRKRVNKESQVD